MKESDFPQFDDPRVREVFAMAANLVEDIYKGRSITISADALKTALFAAQHSKPKKDPRECLECSNTKPQDSWHCFEHLAAFKANLAPQHSRPWQCKKEGPGICCTSEECRPGYLKPKHVEVVMDTCLGGCECPRCGENTFVSLKRCTKCHGDGVSHCVICGVNG